jgi:hypothetical protein
MNLEVTNLRRDLEERLHFEMLLADLSSKFVNLPADDLDDEIMAAQRRICEFLDLDIMVLWQLSDEAAGFFSATHFYSSQHGPQPAGLLHQEYFPWFRAQLLAGRIVGSSSLEELPAEARHAGPRPFPHWRLEQAGGLLRAANQGRLVATIAALFRGNRGFVREIPERPTIKRKISV